MKTVEVDLQEMRKLIEVAIKDSDARKCGIAKLQKSVENHVLYTDEIITRSEREILELRETIIRLERERDDARDWQRHVAEACGYMNQPEDQDGYEVADARTVVSAIARLQGELHEALDSARRARTEGYAAGLVEGEARIADLVNACTEARDEGERKGREGAPDDLRAKGWSVAVHNDYRLHGERHTFWLLTYPDGRYLKGEGTTDAGALNQIRAALDLAAPVAPATLVLEASEPAPRLECARKGGVGACYCPECRPQSRRRSQPTNLETEAPEDRGWASAPSASDLRAELHSSTAEPRDPVHPTGHCTCCGEGTCVWCKGHCPYCGSTLPSRGNG